MTFATAYQEKKSHLSTPPIYTGMKGKRKSSVTFNLPENEHYEEEEKDTIFDKEQLLSPCTVTSPTIDICAHTVPDTMLVALFDRSSEMKGLVRHNKTFFLSLQQHLDTKWTRFENTLYCERVKMPDHEWMNRISKALQGVPSLLEKFKELVGYMGEEKHEEDEDNDDTTSTGDCEYFSTVDIARIRDYPDRISATSYPQFFINCQGFMQDDARLELFKTTLNNTNRKEYSDELWESEIYKQLKDWPNLLEQLQEIVSYEIEA